MVNVLCVGHAAHDLVYRVPAIPADPVKVIATDFYECGGGMAANAAVAIARLGGHAHYCGRVADDALGARILRDLEAEGVDCSLARKVPGCRSPLSSILVDDRGHRLICSYTDGSLDPDTRWIPLATIARFQAVLVDVRWPEGSAAVLDAARAAAVPALLDADVAGREVLRDLASRATHALFSQPGLARASNAESASEALRDVRTPTHRVTGVTQGEDGFLWLDDEGEHRGPAHSVVAIDTLAAGDVWHGALALAIAEGQAMDSAVRFANAAAAIKCCRPGGRLGAPFRPEVNAVMSARS
jgi:sulfofructose kinase